MKLIHCGHGKFKKCSIARGLDPRILLKQKLKCSKGRLNTLRPLKITYIFNLGHGLLPETDPDKVEKLIKFYRNF